MPHNPDKSRRPPDPTYVEHEQDTASDPVMFGRTPTDATGAETAEDGAPDLTLAGMPSPESGAELGSGRIVGVLGDGGMARVYKVWSDRLEMERAVKVLRPDQSSTVRERFETEAKITAKLRHPNIAEIHTVGEFGDLPYIEMELVDGWPLDRLLQDYGPLPAEVCTAIAVCIARALTYAHAADILIYGSTYHGVVHRDLKPANIMLRRDGVVKLMDFGIARPAEAGLHTAEGVVVGTVRYLSPEQLHGGAIDARTDIFAFGVILYEMLTRAQFDARSLEANQGDAPPGSSSEGPAQLKSSLPGGLGRIVRRCLAFAPGDRYDNADALLKAVSSCHRRLTSHTPEEILAAFAASPGQSATDHGRSTRWLRPVLAAAAIAALIGGTIWYAMVSGPTDPGLHTPKAVADTRAEPTQDAAARAASERPPAPPDAAPETDTVMASTPTPVSASPGPAARKTAHPSRSRRPPSPTARLARTYGTSDMYEAGHKALAAGKYADATLALKSVPAKHPKSQTAAVLLCQAYLAQGKTAEARKVADTQTATKDAQLDLLRGELARRAGDTDRALDYYQEALLKPSATRPVNAVRSDALTFTARILTARHESAPNAQSRVEALTAWLAVKRLHENSKEHPHFVEANKTMAAF